MTQPVELTDFLCTTYFTVFWGGEVCVKTYLENSQRNVAKHLNIVMEARIPHSWILFFPPVSSTCYYCEVFE